MGTDNQCAPSPENTTTNPLANGETFVGEGVINNYNAVLVGVITDQTGLLYIECGMDGINWDSSQVFTVAADLCDIHRLVKGYRYFRVRFTNNSGSDQTYFRLSSTFGDFGPLTFPKNLSVPTDADSSLVHPTDFKLDQAQGKYLGESLKRITGYNGDVDTVAEVVGDLSTTTYAGFLTTATTVRIKAGGSVNDTAAGTGARTIVVEGLNENFLEASETITTNGASASTATTTTFIRVLGAYVATAGTYHGANDAAVTIENGAGGTDLLQIGAGLGKAELAVYTVSAIESCYLTNLRVDVEGTKQAEVRLYQLQNADDSTAPTTGKKLILRLPGLSGHSEHPFTQYVPIPAKSDVWVEAIGPSGGTAIAVGFEMVCVAT